MQEQIQIIETWPEVHKFFGSRKSAHNLSPRQLIKIKEEAKDNIKMLHCHGLEVEPSIRMQFNGALAARKSIIDRVDDLLKAKGLGVNQKEGTKA
jgi:hypothetical protein